MSRGDMCVSHPSSTKEAFRLSRGAWDRDSVVMTSSRKPTSSLRSSSYTHTHSFLTDERSSQNKDAPFV